MAATVGSRWMSFETLPKVRRLDPRPVHVLIGQEITDGLCFSVIICVKLVFGVLEAGNINLDTWSNGYSSRNASVAMYRPDQSLKLQELLSHLRWLNRTPITTSQTRTIYCHFWGP